MKVDFSEAVKDLVKKATQRGADEALKYSQAAVNTANAQERLNGDPIAKCIWTCHGPEGVGITGCGQPTMYDPEPKFCYHCGGSIVIV